MTKPTPHGQVPEALPAIQRFEVVDCIDSQHVPAVIPNPSGPWVRYEDHAAALRTQQPAPAGATDPQLLQFYGVSTDAELISAQARHIEKLQAKLSPTPSFAPQRVREG